MAKSILRSRGGDKKPIDSVGRRQIRGLIAEIRRKYVAELGTALYNGSDVFPLMLKTFTAAFLLGKRINRGGPLTDREKIWLSALAHDEADFFAGFRSMATANEDREHSYCSTQIDLVGPVSEAITRIAKMIDPEDLISLQDPGDHHVTVKYGLLEDDPAPLQAAVKGFGPFTISLGHTAAFKNEDADVLALTVRSDRLMELNKLVAQTSAHVETQPQYIPHATIAYLKPGTSDKYNIDYEGAYLVDGFSFSNRDRRKTVISIKPEAAHEMAADVRLELYGGAVDASFWNGWVQDLPPGAEIDWKLGVAEHCSDCLTLALQSPYGRTKPLPTVPRIGQTRCVVSADSLILTSRGEVPIRDVVSGDTVLTHRNRWRKVLATPRSTLGNRRVVAVGSVVVTADHPLLTAAGWVEAGVVGICQLPVYTKHHAEVLDLRCHDPLRPPIGTVQEVQFRLSDMRRPKELQVNRVHLLRDVQEGQSSVGLHRRNHALSHSRCAQGEKAAVRGPQGVLVRDDQKGWSEIRQLLEGRPIGLRLPIPMAVDKGSWGNSCRHGGSPRQRGPFGRSALESPPDGVRRSLGDALGQARSQLQGTRGAVQDSRADLSGVQKAVSLLSKGGQAPKVLLLEVQEDPERTVYDLTVDEDHSFICDGIILHNCLGNCRCFLVAAAPGFFSSNFGPLIEVTAIGALQVDPSSDQAMASAGIFLATAQNYMQAKRLQAAGVDYAGILADTYLGTLNRLGEDIGVTWRFGMTAAEIQEPIYDLLARGYRLVRPEDLKTSLVGAEAVYVETDENVQGRITAVDTVGQAVDIEGKRYGLGVMAQGILFVAGQAGA